MVEFNLWFREIKIPDKLITKKLSEKQVGF